MSRINYGRLIAGAVLAGVFFFIADGLIHGKVLASGHEAAVTGAGKSVEGGEDPTAYVYFAAFDLGKGLVVMLLYVAARSRFGSGPKTAVWAGLVGWFATEMVPRLADMPMPFYEPAFYWTWIALELVPMVIGTILGAWVYKEGAAAA